MEPRTQKNSEGACEARRLRSGASEFRLFCISSRKYSHEVCSWLVILGLRFFLAAIQVS